MVRPPRSLERVQYLLQDLRCSNGVALSCHLCGDGSTRYQRVRVVGAEDGGPYVTEITEEALRLHMTALRSDQARDLEPRLEGVGMMSPQCPVLFLEDRLEYPLSVRQVILPGDGQRDSLPRIQGVAVVRSQSALPGTMHPPEKAFGLGVISLFRERSGEPGGPAGAVAPSPLNLRRAFGTRAPSSRRP